LLPLELLPPGPTPELLPPGPTPELPPLLPLELLPPGLTPELLPPGLTPELLLPGLTPELLPPGLTPELLLPGLAPELLLDPAPELVLGVPESSELELESPLPHPLLKASSNPKAVAAIRCALIHSSWNRQSGDLACVRPP
jgi:hypothetical protein